MQILVRMCLPALPLLLRCSERSNQLEFIHEPCLLGEWEKDVYVAEMDSRTQKCYVLTCILHEKSTSHSRFSKLPEELLRS